MCQSRWHGLHGDYHSAFRWPPSLPVDTSVVYVDTIKRKSKRRKKCLPAIRTLTIFSFTFLYTGPQWELLLFSLHYFIPNIDSGFYSTLVFSHIRHHRCHNSWVTNWRPYPLLFPEAQSAQNSVVPWVQGDAWAMGAPEGKEDWGQSAKFRKQKPVIPRPVFYLNSVSPHIVHH